MAECSKTQNSLRRLIRLCTPPLVVNLWQRVAFRSGYSGSYSSWTDALAASTGYDSEIILSRVRDALLQVKEGKAVYERDSVLFDHVEYSWPLLAALLWVASLNDNRLNVLDFGGSLGSSYYQNRKFLAHLQELSWSVVEQESFVLCGREAFADGVLTFHASIEECLAEKKIDLLLLGSVIQYLENPYDFLSVISSQGFKFIVFDRTPFVPGDNDLLTVQKVSPDIYDASYPSWFFGECKFKEAMSRGYELVAEFDTPDHANIAGYFKGFIYRLKASGGGRS